MKYNVDVCFSGTMTLLGIEADDEAEAREIALETFDEEYDDVPVGEATAFITDCYED